MSGRGGLSQSLRRQALVCVCVSMYLTSGFAWPVRPRDAGPGADHRTGRAELPIYIIGNLVLEVGLPKLGRAQARMPERSE